MAKSLKARLKRARKRAKISFAIVQDMEQRLLNKLEKLAGEKTTEERVNAQVAFYYTCNIVEQRFLMKVFKQKEDKELTALAG